MTSKERLEDLKQYLDTLYPHTRCFLNHKTDYELLFAVVMSAQSQDKSVNRVNEILFKRYPTLNSFATADPEDIEVIIRPVGLAPTKARNIVAIASELIKRFDGHVPSDRESLMSLPGVGFKTASVVRGELFGGAELPVDTHVKRIVTRLKIVPETMSPTQIEGRLLELYMRSDPMNFHRQIITFGREICLAGTRRRCQHCLLPWCEERIPKS